MKKLALAAALLMLITSIIGCAANSQTNDAPIQSAPVQSVAPTATPEPTAGVSESIDYAQSVQPGADTARLEVTVKTFIDGDTVHFNAPDHVIPSGVLKARFIGIDTPESTGKIEEYGKAAAEFTKQTLSGAYSVMLETDGGNWELDSTGGRYLAWVWYKADKNSAYRNLNIELLQLGLANAYSSANNRYGSACMAAISQAKANKLNIYSGQKDPDFYYGDAIELTLKELRCNIADYNGKKVAFEGVITMNSGNGVYIEDHDAESGRYFGISAYYGYGLSGAGLDILSVGNRARIVGTVQYYEAGGYYQISGLSYRQMKPDDPNNLQKLSQGNAAAYSSVSAAELNDAEEAINSESGSYQLKLSDILMNTTVEVDALKVESYYYSEESGSATLYCSSGAASIAVRLETIKQAQGELELDTLLGQTLTVRGVLDTFDGELQIHVFTTEGIAIQ